MDMQLNPRQRELIEQAQTLALARFAPPCGTARSRRNVSI